MRGNNKRKLLNELELQAARKLYVIGVPLTKIIRDLQLSVSRLHLLKLFLIYNDIVEEELKVSKERHQLRSAIFPLWLNNTKGIVEQPNEWTYKGRFPFGEWILRTELTTQKRLPNV